jgi:cytidylate kinase
MSIVTIRGQLGSGAPEVGRALADKLKGDYVDREILAEVAGRLDRREQEIREKEMPPSSLLGRIAEALARGSAFGDAIPGAYLPMEQIPLGDARYLHALEAVIMQLAQGRTRPLVILGRGSNFILKEYPAAMHVLTVAPLDVRVERVMKDLGAEQDVARQEITRFDNSLRVFTRKYFNAELEDPVHYHLIVNTGRFTLEASVSVILDALSDAGSGPA